MYSYLLSALYPDFHSKKTECLFCSHSLMKIDLLNVYSKRDSGLYLHLCCFLRSLLTNRINST